MIRGAIEALMNSMQAVASKAYEKASARGPEPGPGAAGKPGAAEEPAGGQKRGTDAEYEVVDD